MKPDLFALLPDVVLFVAVARAKNFSRAARALGMPVSTLSRRIAEFEARLGTQLLVRSTRRLELTEPGATYFERCQLIVDAAEAAHAELHGHSQHPRGHLRVSVTQDFAVTYLVPIFAELPARYPEITVELDLTARSVDLIGERFDVAIRMGALPDSQLVARKLGAGPVGLYAAPAYLARAGAVRAPADLATHACVRILGPIDRAARWTLVRGDQVETVAITGRFVANSMQLLLELVTAGLGIATLDDAIARPAALTGALVRVLPGWRPPPVPVHALTPSKLLPARTRVFLECLTDHLRIEGARDPDAAGARGKRGRRE